MQFTIVNNLCTIDKTEWDNLNPSHFPFVRYDFLSALERSNAASKQTGWQTHHFTVTDNGKLIAAIPTYIKLHSYGEYVFDFQWAEAYHRVCLEYYPKLTSAIPFSPVTGPRILLHPDYQGSDLVSFILKEIQKFLSSSVYSSWHLLFPNKTLSNLLAHYHLSQRKAVHFKWKNKHFSCFDDFLDTCNSRHRKNIRKERRKVSDLGIHLKQIEGADITESQWQHFYRFYQSTYLKRSGHYGYLNAEFFRLLKKNMRENLMLVIANKGDEMIGAALYLKDQKNLYGRYWGSDSEEEFLHFEACYYQGIEYCIKHKLQYFDPGVQGEHKLQRGFEPYYTYSNHWIKHPEFRTAINHFLKEELAYIEQYFDYTLTRLPFKEI